MQGFQKFRNEEVNYPFEDYFFFISDRGYHVYHLCNLLLTSISRIYLLTFI